MVATQKAAPEPNHILMITTISAAIILMALGLIAWARKRLQNLREIQNVSLNILNLWLFRFMIAGLCMTVIQNIYLQVIIRVVSHDNKKASIVSANHTWLAENIWFSVTVMAAVQWMQNVCNYCMMYF